jgi:glycosyltransferase involved in cell wall biosynthesis
MELIGALNRLCDTKMLFLNSWSNDDKTKAKIASIREHAIKHGVPEENIIFSSEMGRHWELGVPQEVVHDMYQISNMLVFPSTSETFSFTLAEAAATKNFLVLNGKLEVMRELVGDDAHYIDSYAKYSGIQHKIDYKPSRAQYIQEQADRIYIEMRANKPLMAQRTYLKKFRAKNIWESEMKPLVLGEW